MSFSNMLEFLKEKDRNKIIMIKTGVFYIATGRDAVFLGKELGLKCICFKNKICKVGVPENTIEKYVEKLNKLGLGYIVYDFDSSREELNVKYSKEGKYHNEINDNKGCLECKGIKGDTNDKYMKAIIKIVDKELEE